MVDRKVVCGQLVKGKREGVCEGKVLRGTEQGCSGGGREDWNGEEEGSCAERVNTAGLRWSFLRKACLQGWTLAGIWEPD